MALLDKPLEIREIIATDPARARALNDPVRTTLLELLSHRPMSVEEMTRELGVAGIHKAPTTVRHHVDLLKDAGLIDLVRLEEAGGGMLKYYAATARVLDYELPSEGEEDLAPLLDDAAPPLEELAQDLLKRHGKTIERVAQGMRQCEHCNTQHFKEYLLVRIIQQALARSLHAPRVVRALKKKT